MSRGVLMKLKITSWLFPLSLVTDLRESHCRCEVPVHESVLESACSMLDRARLARAITRTRRLGIGGSRKLNVASQLTRFCTEGSVSQEYVRSHRFVTAVPLSGDGALGQPTVLPVLDIRRSWFNTSVHSI